jgi:hypothetical protein
MEHQGAYMEQRMTMGSIPAPTSLRIARTAMDFDTACETCGVSLPLLRMRVNGSGAHIRMKRTYL